MHVTCLRIDPQTFAKIAMIRENEQFDDFCFCGMIEDFALFLQASHRMQEQPILKDCGGIPEVSKPFSKFFLILKQRSRRLHVRSLLLFSSCKGLQPCFLFWDS